VPKMSTEPGGNPASVVISVRKTGRLQTWRGGSSLMLIFVYGTLRSGESNHAQLRGARFVGIAHTEQRYELVNVRGYPALFEDGSVGVSGELYEVDDALLRRLDEFEEVPEVYQRKSVSLTGNQYAQAYTMRRMLAAKVGAFR
jgi:gamma-glutamylcyclotransferase (GGCT)/AIG2-like uncharacterized protein YtfP